MNKSTKGGDMKVSKEEKIKILKMKLIVLDLKIEGSPYNQVKEAIIKKKQLLQQEIAMLEQQIKEEKRENKEKKDVF